MDELRKDQMEERTGGNRGKTSGEWNSPLLNRNKL